MSENKRFETRLLAIRAVGYIDKMLEDNGCHDKEHYDEVVADLLDILNPQRNRKEEGVCPVCGNQIDYDYFELCDEGGLYRWQCPKCGSTGKEGYDLVFDGEHYDVHLADGTPFEKGEQEDG